MAMILTIAALIVLAIACAGIFVAYISEKNRADTAIDILCNNDAICNAIEDVVDNNIIPDGKMIKEIHKEIARLEPMIMEMLAVKNPSKYPTQEEKSERSINDYKNTIEYARDNFAETDEERAVFNACIKRIKTKYGKKPRPIH